jgi:formyl-CoA transferase
MLDSVAGLLTYQAANYLTTGHNPPRMGNAHASIVPYGTFDTRDGQLMLAVGNDDQWRRFCDSAGLSELATEERFSTNPQRVANRELLWPIVAGALRIRDRDDWTTRLRQAGVPCGPVRTIGETLADAQLEARGMLAPVRHPAAGDLRLVANPVKLSGTTTIEDSPAPLLGQHTEAILTKELGLSSAEFEELRRKQVV